MSLARGRFGIEYNPRPRKEESSGLGWLVLLVLVVATVSFTIHAINMGKGKGDEVVGEGDKTDDGRITATEEGPAANNRQEANVQPKPLTPDSSFIIHSSTSPAASFNRPPRVKNLLLRLEEAEKMGNVEMAVTTIETLRGLPGEPAADLDDKLARRLGELNGRWLFNLANKQWVTEVKVRPGESATRIATAHGTTLAALVRLNNLEDANHIRTGQTIKVMDHPRFSLTVHKRAKYADLHLNGKFFKRYDLNGDVIGEVGVYAVEAMARPLFKTLGLDFTLSDRVEIETLLPKGASIVVSET